MSAATHVLVLNSGSSSVKYRLIDMSGSARPASGLVERIGERASRLVHRPAEGRVREQRAPVADHGAALKAVAGELEADGCGLGSPALAAIGHRVVHGGRRFTEPTLIDDTVLTEIERLVPLAPLHNPANIAGIRTALELGPGLPQVAVFDTAFHTTIPEYAARYAIDRETADRHLIRRYGFHGTSHAHVARATARLLDREPADTNTVVLHLGNGASAAAVQGGRCVDTSMGLTPLEGLVMGTRSGDIDPAVVFHLYRHAGMSVEEIDALLNRKSGLLGLCGENDMREIRRRIDQAVSAGSGDLGASGDRDGAEAARLAFDVYTHRLKKYIGAYCAVLGRVDALAFTAGVGENDPVVRASAVSGLDRLGLEIDPVRNEAPSDGPRLISAPGARTAVAVVPTDEELEIATQTYQLVSR